MRLLWSFLAVSVVPLLVLAFVVESWIHDEIERQFLERAASVAAVQELRLESVFDELEHEVALIGSRTALRNSVRACREAPIEAEVARIARIAGDAAASSDRVLDIHVWTPAGLELAAVRGQHPDGHVRAQQKAARSIGYAGLRSRDGEVEADFVAPLELEGEVIGSILVTFSIGPLLAPLIDATGLGATGEVMLAHRAENGDAVFIARSRLSEHHGFDLRVAKHREDVPITRALAGEEMAVASGFVDYAERPVVFATRFIDGVEWGLVVKFEQSEVADTLAGWRSVLAVLVAVLVALCVVLSLWIARTVSRPIHSLELLAREVPAGRKDFGELVDEPGEVGFLARTMRDVSGSLAEQRQVVQRHLQELETANEELERFAFVASHDLQEPLRKIMLFSEMLSEDLGAAGISIESAEHLEYVHNAAQRMRTLIRDLLELSRASNRDMSVAPLALDSCVDEAIDNLASAIEETGARIERQPLPVVEGDRTLLVQLFQNLIGNALKFSTGGVPKVFIGVRTTNEGTVFFVRDEGPGIDPKFAAKVFEPFQRLHTRAAIEGSGIGLSVCARAVARHGGRIWIDGDQGVGACFSFTLGPAPVPAPAPRLAVH